MSDYFTTRNFGRSFLPAIRSLLRNPRIFFENMTKTESYRESTVFLCLILLMLGFGIVVTVESVQPHFVLPACIVGGLALFRFQSIYMSWTARVFAGVELSEESAFQICAYSSVPMVLDWVPYLMVATIMMQFYLSWRGLVSHGKMPIGAASVIVLLPLTFLIAMSIAFVMFMALAGVDLVTPYLPE